MALRRRARGRRRPGPIRTALELTVSGLAGMALVVLVLLAIRGGTTTPGPLLDSPTSTAGVPAPTLSPAPVANGRATGNGTGASGAAQGSESTAATHSGTPATHPAASGDTSPHGTGAAPTPDPSASGTQGVVGGVVGGLTGAVGAVGGLVGGLLGGSPAA